MCALTATAYTRPLRPDQIMERAAVLLQQEVLSCDQITGGLTNLNYRIDTARASYVYRTPLPGAHLLVNRWHEEDAIKAIAPIGLDVPTVFFNAVSGEKITSFVNNIFSATIPVMQRTAHVSRLLHKLHHSGAVFRNDFTMMDKLAHFEAVMAINDIPLPPGYTDARNELEQFHTHLLSLLRGIPLAPCHNDVVPENILLDQSGAGYLIDWEYAGMNDPAWDLAAYSLESNMAADEEEEFLALYFNGRYNEAVKTRMSIHKICQDVLWCLWAKIKAHFGADLSAYAEHRYQRALGHLKRI
jgi:thiamine kinase-like enzyme